MKLHLIRHAKTQQQSISGKDFDRKLLPKGINQANVLSNFLALKGVQFELTWCSTAVRTQETFSILRFNNDLGKIVFSDEFYLCDKETLLAKIWDLDHGNDLLIIGHNDGISTFASYLLDDTINLRTSEYLCIEFHTTSWNTVSRGTGVIVDSYRPSVLILD
jgi:phosphohistidine phosphatase